MTAVVEKDEAGMAETRDTKTYRGRTLEEVIPQIKAELGPDAVITRQRDGLTGGVGGFFQKQFVEIEAQAGAPRLDLVDDSEALPDLLQNAAVGSRAAGRCCEQHPCGQTHDHRGQRNGPGE